MSHFRVCVYAAFATLAVGFTLHPASALSLEEGKKKGLVGETASGYLAPVTDSPEVTQLTGDVNAKRKQAYRKIAEKHGSPLEVVEQIGGKEAIENSPSGTLVKSATGKWQKK